MKKLIMSVFLMLFVCGCSSSNSISYEDMFAKMVVNAPSEYEEGYLKGLAEGEEENIKFLKDEFSEYIESETIDSMIATHVINTFYNYSIDNNVEISLKDTKVTEGSDNHYSFDITYTAGDEEGKFEGKFQTNDEGLINYFRVTVIDLE